MMISTELRRYYDRAGVVELAHAQGLTHITEHSVATAAYKGDRPLRRTKVNGRVYYAHNDVEAWLSGNKVGD